MIKGNKKILHFNLIFRPEAEGGFTVLVPALPGCVSYGETLVEAKEMIHDAIEGYVASAKKNGEKIMSDEESFMTTLDFSYA